MPTASSVLSITQRCPNSEGKGAKVHPSPLSLASCYRKYVLRQCQSQSAVR